MTELVVVFPILENCIVSVETDDAESAADFVSKALTDGNGVHIRSAVVNSEASVWDKAEWDAQNIDTEEAPQLPIIVDDFIDYGLGSDRKPGEVYARFVLNFMRMPSILQLQFEQYTQQYQLFCVRDGVPYRITGASRFGDVWLSKNLLQKTGYDLRVCVDEIDSWHKTSAEAETTCWEKNGDCSIHKPG